MVLLITAPASSLSSVLVPVVYTFSLDNYHVCCLSAVFVCCLSQTIVTKTSCKIKILDHRSKPREARPMGPGIRYRALPQPPGTTREPCLLFVCCFVCCFTEKSRYSRRSTTRKRNWELPLFSFVRTIMKFDRANFCGPATSMEVCTPREFWNTIPYPAKNCVIQEWTTNSMWERL